MKEYRLNHEVFRIETELPLQSLLSMSIKIAPDIHSELEIVAIIGEERQEEILDQNWQGVKFLVILYREVEECLYNL